LPEGDVEIGATLSALGEAHYRSGKLKQARAALDEAQAIYDKEVPENDPRLSAQVLRLARTVHAQGDTRTAEPLYRRALTLREAALDPADRRTIEARNGLDRAAAMGW
jgi:tetratricopeptide (TPR) repeat protein